MRVLDVFSCIGCHAMGMQRSGHEVVALCEKNPWRRALLERAFGLTVHDDVRTIRPPQADICFGGPPCQRTSVASAISGNRTGETLWPYMFSSGLSARAEWFVVEQPPGNAAWEREVASSLCDAGRHVAIFEFGACDVGAPYLRRRRYVVACASLPRLALARSALPQAIERAKRAAAARGDWDPSTIPTFGVDDWRSEDVHERRERIEALGDSNPPAMAEAIGWMLDAVSRDSANG